MPKKNRKTRAATVGVTHFCSEGLSAGMKKPRHWKMMMGQHTMTAKKAATLNLSVKPPSAVVT